jgi:hypothetical protein
MMSSDYCWILVLDARQLAVHDAAHLESILRKIFSKNDIEIRECGGSTQRIARVRAGHRAGRIQIHYILATEDRRNRQRAAESFSKASQVRNDLVMFKAKEPAGPSEPSLYLVEDQERLMPIAPTPELLDIFLGTETRSPSLIRLQQNARDVSRFDAEALQRRLKNLEANVLGAKTVRVRHLYKAGS